MNKERKNLLVFGYGLTAILGFIGTRLYVKHGFGTLSAILLFAALGFLAVSFTNVKNLKPFYIKWMKMAHFIGNIVTGILLSIVFYLAFGLVGIIIRLLKKDILHEKQDKAAESYWIKKKKEDAPDKVRLEQQF
ncbi:MAG: SxtJ family membrane protein [Candidatus Zapsychrus exili]|nr:SxtJ family membrane protein [Candidatus Zapsychrus exili]